MPKAPEKKLETEVKVQAPKVQDPKTNETKPAQKKPVPPKKEPKKKEENQKEEVAKAESAPIRLLGEPERKVIYPVVNAEVCTGDNAITVDIARQILGWETEEDFISRLTKANPGLQPDSCKFGEIFMLSDANGKKIRCWHNLDNRPFDVEWSKGLAQTLLNGQWAGPTTIPGETINGSTVVLSRTGKVESGQHSLTALVLADQLLQKNPEKYPFWDGKKLILETILVTGISEDRRVIMTVDNCKPRTEADVFYTSEMFVHLSPIDRKEYSRGLAAAADLLWLRTDTKGYKTHTEIMSFVERHKKLLKCIEHIYKCNAAAKGRTISTLRLSPGQSAALMYFMATSLSDGDVYRNGYPPSEKGLDWTRLDKAKEFWDKLVQGEEFQVVRKALAILVSDDSEGLGGMVTEKHAVIQRAWDGLIDAIHFNDNDIVEPDGQLYLQYGMDKNGNKVLLSNTDFEGIYVPPSDKSKSQGGDPFVPPDIVLKMTDEERRKQAEEITLKLREMRLGKDAKPIKSMDPPKDD